MHATTFGYVPLEEYRYVKASLDSGTTLRLLLFSGGAPQDKDHLYYYQFICLNPATGDTVRILSPLVSFSDPDNPNTYTSPLQIDPHSGVQTATYQPMAGPWLNLALQIQELPTESGDLPPGLVDSLQAQVHQKQYVVINNAMEAFRTHRYNTAVGILHFAQRPW